MKKTTIGIIGNGFVGEAIAFCFSSLFEVFIFDTNPKKSKNSLDSVHKCDFVFVCVPTPMDRSGNQDFTFVENAFLHANSKPIYILKSTVLPGSTLKLNKKYPNLKLIFSPEFLTERTAKTDMLTQARIILGGKQGLVDEVEIIFKKRFKNKNIIKTDSKTAELIKYMNNTFFASKISLMNEFKLISNKVGANWEDALHGFISDGRIADSHVDVPGHDGLLGYGGTCFPKDVNAFINFAKKNNVNVNTIIGGLKTNEELRKEKDWESKIGRSVNFNRQ